MSIRQQSSCGPHMPFLGTEAGKAGDYVQAFSLNAYMIGGSEAIQVGGLSGERGSSSCCYDPCPPCYPCGGAWYCAPAVLHVWVRGSACLEA